MSMCGDCQYFIAPKNYVAGIRRKGARFGCARGAKVPGGPATQACEHFAKRISQVLTDNGPESNNALRCQSCAHAELAEKPSGRSEDTYTCEILTEVKRLTGREAPSVKINSSDLACTSHERTPTAQDVPLINEEGDDQ